MTISIDTSALLSYYQSRTGQTGAGSTGTGSSATAKTAPTAPWDSSSKAPRATDLVKTVLAGRKFVDLNAAQLDVPGAIQDYRRMFALFQGLNALNGLAERAGTKGVTDFETARLKTAFAKGMGEVTAFLDTLKMEQMQLSRGVAGVKLRTEVGVKRDDATYVTPPVHTGLQNDPVAAFAGTVKFDLSIKVGAVTKAIAADLAEMGATPRTMANVVIYLNGKLQAQGVQTRFAVERIPAVPETVTTGGKTITLPGGADSFALKIKGDVTEALTLSAPATSGAVYLAQVAGKDTLSNQLLKFQTDTTISAQAAPAAFAASGETYTVAGRVFSRTLGAEVTKVRSTAAGPDGSVYVLADITAPSDGQAIKGDQDVALLKYDSVGQLVYSRTLGAAETASGMALAVAADGRVAVAGSVTGSLVPGAAIDKADVADSFVTLFDASGQEVWSQRRAAKAEDEATAVAFGNDGAVYVAGRTKSAMLGGTQQAGWDGYLNGFSSNAAGAPIALFTKQFGTVGDDGVGGIAVNGDQVIVGGVENGRGVLRSFTVARTTAPISGGLTTTAATATAGTTRDLGDLKGGTIAGLAISGGNLVVAGSTRNGALAGGTITSAYGAGLDAFAARISTTLTTAGTDRLTYFGGAGDNAATALTVANGEVWIAGTATGALTGLAAVGDKDGFLARLDIAAGTATWSRRFTASEKQAAPTAIAVDPDGATVLDRLGLPGGTLAYADSKRITAATSVCAGDQFFVKMGEGAKGVAVTVAEDDTLKTLASKIAKAAGFRATVTVVKDGLYDRLEIKSLNERYPLELTAGKGGKNALESLGLSEGVIRTLRGGVEEADLEKVYGLKLAPDLDLDSPVAIKKATDNLLAAMAVIRTAYRDLKAASEPQPASAAARGPVPAYLSSQIANYQAALNRLSGGW